MIATRFWNDMNHYYMILEEIKEHSYSMQMVLNNHISGVLQAELRREDDHVFCYYEISGKESLQDYLEHGVINESLLQKLLVGIIEAVQSGQGYLLEENDFILEPKFIFWEANKEEISLCYHPGYQIPFHNQMKVLIEYLMNKVNYKEEGAVLLIYALYKKVNEVGCTFQDLLNIIQDFRKKTFCSVDEEEKAIRYEQEEKGMEQEGNESSTPAYRPLREKVEGETEVLHYPVKNYVGAGISFIFCFLGFIFLYRIHFFENSAATGNGYMKLIGSAVLFLLFFSLICFRLFGKNQKVAKILETTQFIDGDHLGSTTVLCNFVREEREEVSHDIATYQLQPMDGNHYNSIVMNEFPFFIGKLKSKVGHTISDETVSRFHAKIDKNANGFFLMDLNSTNGTYWNGKRLEVNEKKNLHKGDVIAFANVKYQFCEYQMMHH